MSAPERQPPRHHRSRPRSIRERSRDTAWHAAREFAQTVQCPLHPKGCGRPIGQTCVNRWGEELVNQPAHQAREQRAAAAEPNIDHDSEETP